MIVSIFILTCALRQLLCVRGTPSTAFTGKLYQYSTAEYVLRPSFVSQHTTIFLYLYKLNKSSCQRYVNRKENVKNSTNHI